PIPVSTEHLGSNVSITHQMNFREGTTFGDVEAAFEQHFGEEMAPQRLVELAEYVIDRGWLGKRGVTDFYDSEFAVADYDSVAAEMQAATDQFWDGQI